ncbi:unnamed protein product [Cuscuta campestris]|uniref:O-fucosyltransferase family protein n=1 Tax=Cuscuta campestris TaxID=132261 RepID=A0A484MKV0_9ASTE|nr:unnamed protein product [Cuscuta campestris]
MPPSNSSCSETPSIDGEQLRRLGTGLRSPSQTNPFEPLPRTRSPSCSSSSLTNGYHATSSGQRRTANKKQLSRCRPWSKLGFPLLIAAVVLANWWMLYRIQDPGHASGIKFKLLKANASTFPIREELIKLGKGKRPQKTIYARLLAKAAHALAELNNKPEPKDLWAEPYAIASTWKPCAEQRDWKPSDGNAGYIMVTANGGINQQRVAICNAVAVARLLNSTLVLPKFLYSSVWRDVRLKCSFIS